MRTFFRNQFLSMCLFYIDLGLRFLVRFSDHDESTLMCSVCMTLRSAHHCRGGCFLFRSKSEVDPNGFVWFDSELKDIPTERDCRGPGRVSQPSWSHWAESLRRPRPLEMFDAELAGYFGLEAGSWRRIQKTSKFRINLKSRSMNRSQVELDSCHESLQYGRTDSAARAGSG